MRLQLWGSMPTRSDKPSTPAVRASALANVVIGAHEQVTQSVRALRLGVKEMPSATRRHLKALALLQVPRSRSQGFIRFQVLQGRPCRMSILLT